jgi:stage II sporulation protein D
MGHTLPAIGQMRLLQGSNHYKTIISVPNEKINQLYGFHGQKLKIQVLSRTSSGRAIKLSLNGREIYASSLREKLDLPSNWLYFNTAGSKTDIEVHGYGHGMGMCQYGANGMAKSGKNYQQILKNTIREFRSTR